MTGITMHSQRSARKEQRRQADSANPGLYGQWAPGHCISALPGSIIYEGVQEHGLVLCICHAGRGPLLAEQGAALVYICKVGCMTPCTALHPPSTLIIEYTSMNRFMDSFWTSTPPPPTHQQAHCSPLAICDQVLIDNEKEWQS